MTKQPPAGLMLKIRSVMLCSEPLQKTFHMLPKARSTEVISAVACSSSSRISDVHQREHETMPPSTENLPGSGSLGH